MDYTFGYNCANYLPTIGKCRILSTQYRGRSDLVAKKRLTARELLVYINSSPEELIDQVRRTEIVVKVQKDGKVLFELPTAWRWDDCHESATGGQCLHFEPHAGPKITCMKDLQHWPHEHPNMRIVPTDREVSRFEELAVEANPCGKSEDRLPRTSR